MIQKRLLHALTCILIAVTFSNGLSLKNAPVRHDSTAPSGSSEISRRNLVSRLAILAVSSTASVSRPPMACALDPKSRTDGYAIQNSDSEWKSLLSPTQYDILRLGATERPFSSVLEGEERSGIYVCAGCGTKLFDAREKFHSGTGWPSFARALEGVEVEDVNAVTANLAGAELRCRTCGGHLGDVFSDGFLFVGTPAFRSGKRYCIDGAALIFQPSNGDPAVMGDNSPKSQEPSLPDWLAPPRITVRDG